MADTASTGRRLPLYYVAQHIDGPVSYTRARDSDKDFGCSMYRALATLVHGNPDQYRAIRDTVQRFAINVRSNSDHPLHSEYLTCEARFKRRTGGLNIFPAFEYPDRQEANRELCWVISNALKVRITIHKCGSVQGDRGELREVFASNGAKLDVSLLRIKRDGSMPVRYWALLPDESGKEVVEYLESTVRQIKSQADLPAAEQPFAALPMDQISYATIETAIPWSSPRPFRKTVKCFNGFRENSRPTDIYPAQELDRMDSFVAVVNKPEHVEPALEVFRTALELAPNQRRDVKVSLTGKPGIMLPHCGADAEFVKLPKELVDGKHRREVDRLIADGEVEELCSVLTLSVGRHFSVVVNIHHMLENADHTTVPALERLFKETIFNTKIMKLWWHLQSDFQVLDDTIAHMYQGTARSPFWYVPHPMQRLSARTVTPTFRITNAHLNGIRPGDMRFPHGDKECEIHNPGTNRYDTSCPCQTLNVDIAPLLSHFSRLQGFDREKMAWTEYREDFNYGHLLYLMLGHDCHLLPILQVMKDWADKSPLGKDAFYQSLGQPGLKEDDNAMGYVIMDVIGINFIFDQLFARGDAHFVADQLYSWSGKRSDASLLVDMNVALTRQKSAQGAVGNIPLIEDNPERFDREAFWPGYAQLKSWGVREMDASLVATASLSPLHHDQRVLVSRQLVDRRELPRVAASESIHTSLPYDEQQQVDNQRSRLLQKTMDPLALWVPAMCAETYEVGYADPIVRAGQTHGEALADLLRSSHCKDASPPPGFGVAAGDDEGWPDRVPGAGLDNAREIFEAFPVKNGVSGVHLGRLKPRHHAIGGSQAPQPDFAALAKQAIEQEHIDWGGNKWQAKESLRRSLTLKIKKEEANETHGFPGHIDFTDLFDPEGREFRRRIESTPEWNRPELSEPFVVKSGGPWVSTTTEIMKALDVALPQKAEEEYLAWFDAHGAGKRRAGVSYASLLGPKM